MANGYFTPKEAADMREKNLKAIGSEKAGRQLNQAMQSGNVAEIEQIKKNLLEGAYEQNGIEIDPTTKRSLVSTMDSAIKKVSQEQAALMKQNQELTEADFGKRLTSSDPNVPKPTIEDINKAEVTKQITPAYANILRKYITEPTVKATKQEKAMASAKLAEMLFEIDADEDDAIDKGVTFEQLAAFRIAAFDAHSKGLSETKLTSYLAATEAAYQSAFQKSDIGSGDTSKTGDGVFNLAKRAWKAITFQKPVNDEMKAFVFDKLNDRMRRGMTEDQIPMVVRDIQREYYVANDPKEARYEPDQVVTVGGRRFKTYLKPDGRMAFEAQ
jgi:hypothetical protein